jgi:transcriptional regulator with XRE-family HTH domain
MDMSEDFGKRIKRLRVAKGLSKSKLAVASGVSPTAVWNWEEKRIVPRSETLAKAATTLGVSESYLRFGSVGAGPVPLRTMTAIIDDAKKAIAELNGVSPDSVRVKVEIGS